MNDFTVEMLEQEQSSSYLDSKMHGDKQLAEKRGSAVMAELMNEVGANSNLGRTLLRKMYLNKMSEHHYSGSNVVGSIGTSQD